MSRIGDDVMVGKSESLREPNPVRPLDIAEGVTILKSAAYPIAWIRDAYSTTGGGIGVYECFYLYLGHERRS